ncbi:MAG: flagellar hook-basal body complex protein [Candidatus Neomarinimicrobiota bacterium]
MMRALYAGVSGLRSHQFKIDVLGNNIANINTVGYKGARVTFSETLTQLLSGSTKSVDGGYTNPMQIGLGMSLGSIDAQLSQGALESTGNITDLAVQGDGYFVIGSGNKQLYTRAGSFHLDSEGRLTTTDGLGVQGWMSNRSQTIANQGTAMIRDITIDPNMVSIGKASENVWLTGNLNASLSPVSEVWTMGNAMTGKALVTGSAVTVPLSVIAGANDQFTIDLRSGTGSILTNELTLNPGAYATVAALVTEINTQIAASSQLSGKIVAINESGAIKLRAVDANSNLTIEVGSGTNDVLTSLGFSDGDQGTANEAAVTTMDLNDLLQVTTNFASGDTIEIIGTNPDGTTVSATYTYGTDGTTMADLITVINASFTGATASFADGKIVLTDDVAGDSSTTINMVAGSSNTGEIYNLGFTNTTAGFTGTALSSITVYDAMGGSHNIQFTFTKTERENEWTWIAETTGAEQIISGDSGRITFDVQGNMSTLTYDDGVEALSFNPGNGAEAMSVAVHGSGNTDFSGITQYDSASTILANEQDGRSVGSLTGVSINGDGSIVGTFSNGEFVTMAKIAVAQFANPYGLASAGEGRYESTGGSGTPVYNMFGAETGSSIVSGALEMSNVDLAKEFTEMITAQRGFQANAKTITTADQILQEVVQLKR